MLKKMLYTLLSSLLMGVVACSVDIPPADEYTEISTIEDARSLLTSAYIQYPHYEYELSLLSDDFCPTSLSSEDMDQKNFYLWQDRFITDQTNSMWTDYYTTIAYCNILLEKVKEVVVKDANEEKELAKVISEAKTLKALAYFDLLRLFAPAYSDGEENEGIILKDQLILDYPKRSSLKDCVAHIRTLLLEAKDVENEPQVNGWLSQIAVLYLLADLELYAGNYTLAAQYAEDVLSSVGDDVLTQSSYAQLWSPNSCVGRIFGFYQNNTFYVSIQSSTPDKGDKYQLNPSINYTEEDYRGKYSVYKPEENETYEGNMGKYNRMNREEITVQYVNTLRYAGAYFIAAEAYSRIEGKEKNGIDILNKYLLSVGTKPIDETQRGGNLLRTILTEKQKEFVGEGSRYFDLKRTRKELNINLERLENKEGTIAGTIKTDDYRWTFPIPKSEYLYNDNVNQNDGWAINRPN